MACDTDKTITELKRGSTFEQSLVFTDENDDTVNILGWTVESDLKVAPGEELLLSFDIDDSQFASGIVTISATPQETQALPADYTLQYDLKLTTPSSGSSPDTLDCDYWDESEIWDEAENWQISPVWDESEIWDESEDWSCSLISGETTSGSSQIYYTETLYLKTSRHITD